MITEETDTTALEGLEVPTSKEINLADTSQEDMSAEIDLAVPNEEDMSAEIDLAVSKDMSTEMVIASKGSEAPILRQRSIIKSNKEAFFVIPICLMYHSHGGCPVEVGCVGPDSATSEIPIPIRETFIIPPGVRLTLFSTAAFSGIVSMNTPEIVEKISDLFYEFATDPVNTTLNPKQYEAKIYVFQIKIQMLLLKDLTSDIKDQIVRNEKIIRETTRGDARRKAIEAFRDLTYYTDLILKQPELIAFCQIYDGDNAKHNRVPLKYLTRGSIEHKAIKDEEAKNPKKASTNWTITVFQGSPYYTYSKPNAKEFIPKLNEDRTINHEKKSMWNPNKEECETTTEEIFIKLYKLGLRNFMIYDNTCQTLIDKITGLEIVRQSLLSGLQEAELEAIQKQKDITAEYVRISGDSQDDSLLEKFRRESEAIEKEIEELKIKNSKLLDEIDKIKKKLIDTCKKRSRGSVDTIDELFPKGGKKTRRIGLKMTVKKSIRSTMKKTRNKKMKRLNKGRKGRKGRKTKKRFLKNKK